MKKGILIGALAALMLFAFTACENKVPEINYGNADVLAATIVSGDTEYLVGQEFDASRYTIELLLTNNKTVTVNGASNMILDDAEKAMTTAGTKPVTVSYGAGEINKVYITVFNPSALTVDASGLVKTEYKYSEVSEGKNPTANKEGLVVTATYGSGKTAVLDADDYTTSPVICATDPGLKDNVPQSTEVGVDVSFGGVTVEDAFKVSVVTEQEPAEEEDPAKGKVADIAVFYKVNNGTELEALPATLYIGDSVTYEVYAVDKFGDKVGSALELTAGTSGQVVTAGGYQVVAGTLPETITVAADTEVSATVSAIIEGKTYTEDIKVGKGSDTVKAISQVALDTSKTLVANTQFNAEYIVVTGTKASNSTGAALTLNTDYTIDFNGRSYTIPSEGSINVYFYLEYEVSGVEHSDYYMLNVAAPKAEPEEPSTGALAKLVK